ncbi:MAG: farnesyl diphosphate synthase [Pseudomonadota bacterium]|nr:farnesyl diphosphate synthase [Pseudomonadota bacterium]
MNTPNLETALKHASGLIDQKLEEFLVVPDAPEGRVVEAMKYTLMGGGKRLRAFLCIQTAKLFNVEEAHYAGVATAIECAHSYSLVHDDLPAMDDDDMRRGRPSLHKAFDEATAILAGDALLTLAFEIMADKQTHPRKAVRLDLIYGFSKALGARGMVGGQMFDLMSPGLELDAGALTRLQKMKTGALIEYSVDAGCIMGQVPDSIRSALTAYAHDIGLAFQIADDLLDVEACQDDIGKTPGKDEASGKVTFVSLLGLNRAKDQARILVEQAIGHLESFGSEADALREAAHYVIIRGH